jgi:hypothetical protein
VGGAIFATCFHVLRACGYQGFVYGSVPHSGGQQSTPRRFNVQPGLPRRKAAPRSRGDPLGTLKAVHDELQPDSASVYLNLAPRRSSGIGTRHAGAKEVTFGQIVAHWPCGLLVGARWFGDWSGTSVWSAVFPQLPLKLRDQRQHVIREGFAGNCGDKRP